jgi:hypothetical protein
LQAYVPLSSLLLAYDKPSKPEKTGGLREYQPQCVHTFPNLILVYWYT